MQLLGVLRGLLDQVPDELRWNMILFRYIFLMSIRFLRGCHDFLYLFDGQVLEMSFLEPAGQGPISPALLPQALFRPSFWIMLWFRSLLPFSCPCELGGRVLLGLGVLQGSGPRGNPLS